MSNLIIISNSIKRGALAILLNDPNQAGRLIANHLFLYYSFVISCLCEFHLSQWPLTSFQVCLELIRPGLTSMEVRLVKMNLMRYIS